MGPSNHRHTKFDLLALKQGTHLPREDTSTADFETNKAAARPDASLTVGPIQLRTVWESPWKRYVKTFDLELAGWVEVAVRKADPIGLVHVKKFLNPGAEKALHMIRLLQHRNIVTALGTFATDDGLYVVFEPMSICLERMVASPVYPNERQLAALLGQVSSNL